RSRPSSRACPVKFFLFARDGYPPYGTTMVTTRGFVDRNPDVVALFVKASLEGWKSYITNPTPGNALIKADNPKISDEQITFVIEQLKALKVLDGGDAQAMGIGIITEARWNATYDFRVAAGLLKPEVDWKRGFKGGVPVDARDRHGSAARPHLQGDVDRRAAPA